MKRIDTMPGADESKLAIKAVLFDLDGTLLDTAPDLASALNTLLAQQGQPTLPDTTIREHISHGSAGLIQLGFNMDEGQERFAELRQQLLSLYSEQLGNNTQLFPGMDTVLTYLEQHHLPWGIVTNKLAVYTQPLLEKLQLASRARCIISGDTLPYAKPHPAPLIYACELLPCLPAHCLYVGDAERDIQAGRAAGMAAVLARYGYLHGNDQPETWGAAISINHPEDLLNYIAK